MSLTAPNERFWACCGFYRNAAHGRQCVNHSKPEQEGDSLMGVCLSDVSGRHDFTAGPCPALKERRERIATAVLASLAKTEGLPDAAARALGYADALIAELDK